MEVSDRGSGLLMVMMEVEAEYEEEFNRWYDEEHLPERTACNGFLSGRRFRLIDGSPNGQPRYLAIYELESPDVLQTDEYLKMVPPSKWWASLLPHVRVTRNTYREITRTLPDDFELKVDRP